MKSGIYIIENIANTKKYVGQSINVKTRIGKHKSYLKSGKHENIHLQRAYDKYGLESFTFEIVEYCPIELLDERERYYISFYKTIDYNLGYNLESGGNEGKIVSELTRLKKVGRNNPMFGKKKTKEEKENLSIIARGQNSKLTEKDVVKIKELLIKGVSQGEISEKFNVHYSTISKIATFKNWGYLRPDLNERYIEAEKKRSEMESKSIIELHNAGYSMRKIKDFIGIDRRKISKVIRQHRDNQEV